jgi:Fe-S cluster assembly protein SufD
MSAVPTRKDEAWRYSDLKRVAAHWPAAAPEHIIVPADGHLTRHILIDSDDVSLQHLQLVLGRGARAELHVLNLSQNYGRLELDVTCNEGADFTLSAVQLGAAEHMVELVARVHHVGPHATSRQIVRTVVAERATGIYLGRIEVASGAQKTDASQSSKALLLHRTATVNAKPELIIHADDVKCAHGATVGELDKKALFYMAARGISPADARRLLIEAFCEDALETISDEAAQVAARTRVSARLQELLRHA